MKIRMISGTIKEMGYTELCERLGFNSDIPLLGSRRLRP